MLCPICETESESTQQCTICGWQFVYFTQEPSEQEQKEHTLLLQNYRTEFFFQLAKEYYENKQYQETIQSCFISCEHQMYENPLALLALSYKDLANTDEALKYANMSLEINSNNEMAKQVLAELNISPTQQDEIIKLTPEVLKKDMFETTEQHADRIKNLGYVEIGIIGLKGYDADNQKLKFSTSVNKDLANIVFINKPNETVTYEINIHPDVARKLYIKETLPLIVSLEIIDSKMTLTDMTIDKYSFFKEHTEDLKKQKQRDKTNQEVKEQEIKRQQKYKEKEIERQKREKDQFNKSINEFPEIWTDIGRRIEWKTTSMKNKTIAGWNGADGWTMQRLKERLLELNTDDSKIFLKIIQNENENNETTFFWRKIPDDLSTKIGKSIKSFIKNRI